MPTPQDPAWVEADVICPRCGQTASPTAARCAVCGQVLDSALLSEVAKPLTPQPLSTSTATRTDPSWVHHPGWMLTMLFMGVGPLALPQLWRSHAFSRPVKLLLTAAMLALTVLVVVLAIWVASLFKQLFTAS